MNIDALRKLFSYDAETGVITRLSTGKPCGSPHSKARPYLRVNAGEHGMIYAHRLAFALYHGYAPLVVDHGDGDVQNNRILNLRDCTQAKNSRNQRKQNRKTSSKYKGVHFDRQTGKWRADLKIDGKKIRLGRFDSEDEAGAAYNRAAVTYHEEFARLNDVQIHSA